MSSSLSFGGYLSWSLRNFSFNSLRSLSSSFSYNCISSSVIGTWFPSSSSFIPFFNLVGFGLLSFSSASNCFLGWD
jgi:hypothetical protein